MNIVKNTLLYFRRTLNLCLLAGMCCGCSRETEEPLNLSVGKVCIGFKAGIKSEAMTDGNMWKQHTAMGIFMLPAGGRLPEDVLPDAENLKYQLSDVKTGELEPENDIVLYYPDMDKVDFIAYCPYCDTLSSAGYAFSVSDQREMSRMDILYAKKTDIAADEVDTVNLPFEHVLCKVTLNMKVMGRLKASSLIDFSMEDITFDRMPLKARLNLTDGKVIVDGPVGEIHPLKAEETEDGFDATFSAVLIPQENNCFPGRSISFSLQGRNYSVEIADTVSWKACMHYSYVLSIDENYVEIGRMEFKRWTFDTRDMLDEKTTGNWYPGMPFAPYPSMPEQALGETVYVIVDDAETHGAKIMEVLNNRGWAWQINTTDRNNVEQCFFPLHDDIDLYLTETYEDPNPENRPCSILSASTSGDNLAISRRNFKKMLDKEKFPHFPLVITSAGNATATFTQEAWDFCLEYGTLSWDDIVRIKGWSPDENGNWTPEQQAWYKPGDVGAAYIIQDVDHLGHAVDYIVVGREDGRGNKPGPILKDRWICTYYSFGIFNVKTDGTSFSTPYVAKIAAEIKRRAPHYTNDEIAQLIFSTADDLGQPGCDEVYGWGRMNPSRIWEELTNRGY